MRRIRLGRGHLPVIYLTSIATICSLYAAQPIQPVFQQEFQLSSLQALLFTTLMMLPLGVAPLFYGYLLESFSAKILLRGAILALGLLELLFACSTGYVSLLLIRAVQGLMIPAILTSLMSYISYTSMREDVQHAIAAYIASTIVGGSLGRLLSGVSTELLGWRFFFFILGIVLIAIFFLLGRLQQNVNTSYARPSFREVAELVREGQFFWLYTGIFSLFFVFSAMMNFLPFELKKIHPEAGEAGTGFLYIGYAMGIVVSLRTRKIIAFFGSEADAARTGVLLFFAGTSLFFYEDYRVMLAAMFVFCTGLFMAHSLLSGLVNKLSSEKKSIANGLYISFYYMGGTLGSFLPGYFFERFGWPGFLCFLLGILCFSLFAIFMLKKQVPSG